MLSPSPSILRPTRIRLVVLALASALSLITYLDRVCIMRARSDIEADLQFEDWQMGLIFAAFSLGYGLLEVPGGWMGDKWGARKVLTGIVLWWSLFTALTGCVQVFSLDTGWRLPLGSWSIQLILDAFVVMLVLRFLFGAGEAGAYPTITRLVSDWFPFHERASAQGCIWFSARLGGAIAPLVLGRLTVFLGWRQAFLILGCIGAVWAVIFAWWFRNRPEEMTGCNDAERELIRAGRTDGPHDGHSFPPVRALAGSLTVWAMSWAAFWVCFGWYFFPTWQPKYLIDVHHFDPQGWAQEVLTGLPFLCGAVGCLAGGRLSDVLIRRLGRRWGRSLLGLVGFVGAGLCMFAAGFTTTAWQAVTLLCLASLINDLAIPVIWAAAADVGGRYAGTVSGLVNMIGGGGAILSPALIPFVRGWLPANTSSAQEWQWILGGLAVAWFLAAASWLFIDASRPLVAASTAPPSPVEDVPAARPGVPSPESIRTGEPSRESVRR
jgi:MFS family permease